MPIFSSGLGLRQRTITVSFTDIVLATGFAPAYLLPASEILWFAGAVVTTAFNGHDSIPQPFTSVALAGPSGAAGLALGTAFSAVATSAAVAVDGLVPLQPGSTAPLTPDTRQSIIASGTAPATTGTQLVLDFGFGNTPVVRGTTGVLKLYLLLGPA